MTYSGTTHCETEPPAAAGSASSHVGFGPQATSASLDKELIRRPIRARMPAIRACYEDALGRDPSLRGTVTARFLIVGDGTIRLADIDGFDPAIDRCVCDQILQLRYPPFGSARVGGVQVQYPFTFVTTGSSER